MTQAGGDDDDTVARAMAEKVAIWVEVDESRRPVVLFENAGDSPVYNLFVMMGGGIYGGYPSDKPHQGRENLTEFTATIRRRYAPVDEDWDRERTAKVIVGCIFADAAGRWWGRRGNGSLIDAGTHEEVGRALAESMVSVRGGGGRAPLVRVRCT